MANLTCINLSDFRQHDVDDSSCGSIKIFSKLTLKKVALIARLLKRFRICHGKLQPTPNKILSSAILFVSIIIRYYHFQFILNQFLLMVLRILLRLCVNSLFFFICGHNINHRRSPSLSSSPQPKRKTTRLFVRVQCTNFTEQVIRFFCMHDSHSTQKYSFRALIRQIFTKN